MHKLVIGLETRVKENSRNLEPYDGEKTNKKTNETVTTLTRIFRLKISL